MHPVIATINIQYLQTFQLVTSENFEEELQVIEKSKAGIFVGTKTGRIFRVNDDVS